MSEKLKMSTTAAGAEQYSTKKGEAILKRKADTLFRSFLRNPSEKNAEQLELLGAARAAAAAQRWRNKQTSVNNLKDKVAKSYDNIEKLEIGMLKKRKLRNLLKKATAK